MVVAGLVAALTLAAPRAASHAASPAKTGSAKSACSVLGSFGGTVGRGGKVTMTDTGKDSAGAFTIQITLPNGMTTTIRGNYTRKGNEVKMTNTFAAPAHVYGCIGQPSTYQIDFAQDCSTITFHKIADECPGRMHDADGNTLTRQ